MEKKLRQISDTIHQTVYLSELESDMMSTAYFYRLHDVYQSSTVYLTFPSNRTKRYEHSYGTMALAGEMFFSAITNADPDVLEHFFADAEKQLNQIAVKLLEGNIYPTYCNNSYENLSKCFLSVSATRIREDAQKTISAVYENFEKVEDLALNHYIPPFAVDLSKRRFIYQCLLEAVRIVALFHDIGHPPYSHIMESVLDNLYTQCSSDDNEFNTERSEELLSRLAPFKRADSDRVSCLISNPLSVSADLHEQVGLKMLSGAFQNVFSNTINKISASDNIDIDEKSTYGIYYVAVAEFCFSILREQNPFFTSLHRIIDGCIDADRMDYIVRDSRNSGVDWGAIPYKRLLESCKMMESEHDSNSYYVIAFPRKMVEHIDDLMITRYKIFSRINFHHRSYKTALILQKIVKTLAEDYLRKSPSDTPLCPGIADLWNCLSSTLNSGDLYIIQWNDSTLISHLYQTLVDIKKHSCSEYSISREQYDNIYNMLEEFLLNRKHFYSVFKRQSDMTPIFATVFDKLTPLIEKAKLYERKKLEDSNHEDSSFADADDSLKRLNPYTIEGVIKSGDSGALERVFPSAHSLKSIIMNVLEQYKQNGKIGTYLFDENTKRTKTGLPHLTDLSDAIYLYESASNKPELYDTSILETQLVQLQTHCLQYIAYIEPKTDSSTVIADIRNEISNQLCNAIEESMKEMFSCLRE